MDPKTIRAWGQIVISVLVVIAAGYMMHHVTDDGTQKLIVGTVMGAFATTIAFWIGSSTGSQAKDEVISNSYPPGVVQPAANHDAPPPVEPPPAG
jgi:hypothetical protein